MQTVYQVSWFNMAHDLTPPLCFMVIGAIYFRLGVFGPKRKRGFSRAITFVLAVICMVFGIFLLSHEVVLGHRYKSALRNNQCRVVEGTVEVLQEGLRNGSRYGDIEIIRIGTNEFKFSEESMSYHWLVKEGGPLTNGVYARLHVLDGKILKVEMKR